MIIVIAFLLTIIFLKNVLDFLRLVDEYFCSVCSECSMSLFFRKIIIGLCAIQPLIFCSAYVYKKTYNHPELVVRLVDFHYNHSEVNEIYKTFDFNSSDSDFDSYFREAHQIQELIDLTVSSVDFMFFAIPLSVMLCWSNMSWLHYSQISVLQEGVTWNDELVGEIFTYESIYLFENLCFNFAGIGLISNGRTSVEIFYAVFSMTLLLTICISQSTRELERKSQTFLALLIVIIGFVFFQVIFTQLLQVPCLSRIFITTVYFMGYTMLAIGHIFSGAERQASFIIFIRILASLMLSLCIFIVFLIEENCFK